MNMFQKIEVWGEKHHPKWLDILRILLGVVIFMKGYFYVSNTEELITMMSNSKFHWVSLTLAHYVAFAHLTGGVLIAIGLFTRVAVLFQLPVLVGAVVFINSQKGFFSGDSELMFSIIILFMLVFFLVEGSGPWSVDESWKGENTNVNRA
ncbi:MAG: DoxX family protein [Bacteroidota bacterium]